MTTREKEILKKLVESPHGELSPAEFVNGVAQRDYRSVQNLKSMGYIDTVAHQHRDLSGSYYDIPFYFATFKGMSVFYPWYKKIWLAIGNDIRIILVAIITSAITTIIANKISGK